jgi:hypothetical protein
MLMELKVLRKRELFERESHAKTAPLILLLINSQLILKFKLLCRTFCKYIIMQFLKMMSLNSDRFQAKEV